MSGSPGGRGPAARGGMERASGQGPGGAAPRELPAGDEAGAPPRPARVLGIETSCDETAAAVVDDGRVVASNVVASQAALHAPYGGVFPEVAARQHVRDIGWVIERAMREAGADWPDLAAIAVTRGPGLAGALLVGVNAAKGLALATGRPLVGVSHLEGHLASNGLHDGGALLTPERAARGLPPLPPRPHVALVVSGGHTDLWWVADEAPPERLGATRDDAAGEAFDKAARMLGLGYPGGPAIERAAAGGDPEAFDLPVARTGDLDFSFSGLKSALRRHVEALGGDPDGAPEAAGREAGDARPALPVADLAASFQAVVVRALVERLAAVATARGARAVAISGGVAANGALRAALAERFADLPLCCPPLALCTDNAAMIAAAGHAAWRAGARAGMDLDVAASTAR